MLVGFFLYIKKEGTNQFLFYSQYKFLYIKIVLLPQKHNPYSTLLLPTLLLPLLFLLPQAYLKESHWSQPNVLPSQLNVHIL